MIIEYSDLTVMIDHENDDCSDFKKWSIIAVKSEYSGTCAHPYYTHTQYWGMMYNALMYTVNAINILIIHLCQVLLLLDFLFLIIIILWTILLKKIYSMINVRILIWKKWGHKEPIHQWFFEEPLKRVLCSTRKGALWHQ